MAATNVQSGDGGNNSPNSQRVIASSWNQIVRGGEPEMLSPVTVPVVAPTSPSWSLVHNQELEVVSSPDDSGTEGGQADGSDNSGGSKKPVWNRPSNRVVEVVSPVMGAAWPALGESTKPAVKSSSSESLKTLSDGLLTPALQVTGSSSPSHKQATANNVNSTSIPNHAAPAKQRSMKRTSGNSSANVSANGVLSQPPPTSQDSVVEAPHVTSGKPGNNAEQPSPRDHAHKESQRGGLGSHSHSGNDHHHQRGSYRRGNGGQHPRGDGSHHNNYGGRRDHERGNQEWNQQNRSFNNRDTHFQSHRGFPRGYIRPAVHTSASYIPPPLPVPVSVPSFGNNMMYPDMASPVIYVPGPPADPLRPMPFGPPLPPPMYFYTDHQLYAKIVSQIDYYFSNENLVKDTYLRQNMNEQGWVPASLIAGFKKVSSLTDNVQQILEAMRGSTVVEVQGEKIRRRNDWMNWVIPAPVQYSNPSSPQASGLLSKLQGATLQEPNPTSEEVTSPSQQAGGEKTVHGSSHQTDFEPATGA